MQLEEELGLLGHAVVGVRLLDRQEEGRGAKDAVGHVRVHQLPLTIKGVERGRQRWRCRHQSFDQLGCGVHALLIGIR